MDRPIVYPGAIPQDADILNSNKNTMLAIAALAKAIFGFDLSNINYENQMWLDGLECLPNGGLSVQIQLGQIFQMAQTESTAYGSLAIDNTEILKQAFLQSPQSFNCPAPTVSGNYIVYLIQMRYREVDDTSAILKYYNSANPAVPLNGPAGNNAYQNTMRRSVVDVQIKASAEASLTSLVYPSADSGWTGIYNIKVAFGQATIATTDISTLSPTLAVGWGLICKIAALNGKYAGYGIDAFTLDGKSASDLVTEATAKWQGVVTSANSAVVTQTTMQIPWGYPLSGQPSMIDTMSIFDAGNPTKLIVPGGLTSRRVRVKVGFQIAMFPNSEFFVSLKYFKSGATDLVNGQTYRWAQDFLIGASGGSEAGVFIESPVMDCAPGDWFWVETIVSTSTAGSCAIAPGSFFEMEILP